MEKIAIVYPAIAMFLLTIGLILSLGISRFFAIHSGKVSIKYYRLYNEGKQPDYLHLRGRHVQNLFEVPPLFYAGVLFTYVTDQVTLIAISAAWAFVALRVVHSVIHLTSNNVSMRFFAFGLSLLALTVLWLHLLWRLL